MRRSPLRQARFEEMLAEMFEITCVAIRRELRVGPFFQCGAWIEFERPFHRFLGLLLVPGGGEAGGLIDPHEGAIERTQAGKSGDGLVILAGIEIDLAELRRVPFIVIRIEAHGFARIFDGLFRPARIAQAKPVVGHHLGVVGIAVEGLLEGFKCHTMIQCIQMIVGEGPMGPGIAVVAGNRFHCPLTGQFHRDVIVVGPAAIGVDRVTRRHLAIGLGKSRIAFDCPGQMLPGKDLSLLGETAGIIGALEMVQCDVTFVPGGPAAVAPGLAEPAAIAGRQRADDRPGDFVLDREDVVSCRS